MALITAKPVNRKRAGYNNGMDRLFNDFFRMDFPLADFEKSTRKVQPAVNILETEKDFQLEFVAPGWEKSDFNIQLEKDVLTVSAEVKQEEEGETKVESGVTYRRREFGRFGFKRSFQLPENVQVDGIDAKYANGILTVVLPKEEKPEAELTRTIEVA
ncbi:MAG: Hsp20/alpha crystallin family protein [Saprospiraceae bacterium]|nr:Hsp20/alpha crystallin family protein [Lewinella sp.]